MVIAGRIQETSRTRSIEFCIRINGRRSTVHVGIGRARLPLGGAHTYALMIIAAPFWPDLKKRFFFFDDSKQEVSSDVPISANPYIEQRAAA